MQENTTRARSLRKNATDAERRLWQHLRQKQALGYKFRRQHSIGRYIVDFCCIPLQLIVELDGGQHATQASYDHCRSVWLQRRGYRVVRFWNHEVLGEIDAVLQALLTVIEEQASAALPPTPSRKREGE